MVLLTGCSSSGPLGNGGSPLRRLSAARRRRRHRDVGRSRRFRRGGEAVTSLVDAVQTAFQQAKDPELKAIGSTPANMPQLARIFDLEPFLKTPSKERVAQTLDFTRGYATVVNPRPDDFPFATRLGQAISASDNLSTMSCICDVGLPYIQALLRRTGFASLDGRRNPGLWLTVGIDARYYSEITTGASAGNWLPTSAAGR